jgi:hypothetical protein
METKDKNEEEMKIKMEMELTLGLKLKRTEAVVENLKLKKRWRKSFTAREVMEM